MEQQYHSKTSIDSKIMRAFATSHMVNLNGQESVSGSMHHFNKEKEYKFDVASEDTISPIN
jgi:hypothetical protein